VSSFDRFLVELVLTTCSFCAYRLPIPEAIPDSVHSSGPHTEGSELTTDERQKNWVKEIKLEFEKSADPWGRIVVYDLEVLGA